MSFFGLFEDDKPKIGFYSQDNDDAKENKKLLSEKKETLARFENLNKEMSASARSGGGIKTIQGEEGLWIGG